VVVPFGEASTEASISPWSFLPPTQAGVAVAADIVERSSALLYESMLLRRVAKMTGGRALTDNNDLGRIFDLMIESNRGLYVLGYELTREMADGRWHKVRVRVDRDDLEVHAKERYLAPRAP
jgi:VWFA-related protein